MPTNTAMEILRAYKARQERNPAADRKTLFRYILWDRFDNAMVTDAEMNRILDDCTNLNQLTLAVVTREKPSMADGPLEKSAREAVTRYFAINYPDGNR